MTIAQILFTLAAFLKIAIILYPAREQAYIYFNWPRNFTYHFSMTLFMTLVTFIVPCLYPRVTSLLGIVGGLMTGSLGYSIPLALKLASLGKNGQLTISGIGHWILLIIVVTIQIMGTYVSITSDD